MHEQLPAQIRGLIVGLHRDLVQEWPGLEMSNDYLRDRKFLSTASESVVLHDLPFAGKSFDKILALGQESSLVSLSDHLPSRFLKYWVDDVREGDPRAVHAVRQVLHLFSKLQTGALANVDAAYDSFLKRNASLPTSINLDCEELRIARTSLALVLGSLDLRDLMPRHGPGAVATGEKPWQKMQFKRIYSSIEEVYPFCDYFFLNRTHLCDELNSLSDLVQEEAPVAKMVAVPKDFRGPRLISMEPLESQWIQQGQSRAIMHRLETHTLTRGQVNFTDQTVNQRQALLASCGSGFVTLDLKDASDCVSIALTRTLLPSGIFKCLWASRSRATQLPTGIVVPLNMMAPMGNAFCFPLESSVFWALAIAVVHRRKFPYTQPSLKTLKACSRDLYVYGDDLVVRVEDIEQLKSLMIRVGLVPNESKTCIGPHFRESCGCDYYRGVLVTPIRLKTLPDRRIPATLASSCDYINRFKELHMENVSETLLGLAKCEFGRIPMSTRPLPCTLRTASVYEALEWNLEQGFPSRFDKPRQRRLFKVPYFRSPRHHSDVSVWSEAFRSIVMGSTAGEHGYPVPHRIVLTTRWTDL